MDADDSIKKAVKSEKKWLKERAELKKERQKLLTEFLNDTPSRVKVDAGKELIIEPRPLLNNIFRYIFSYSLLGNLGAMIGYAVGYGMVLGWAVSYFVSQFRIPISERQMGIGIFIFAMIYFGKRYVVVDAVKEISELNETFHLKVSGKNFMVHTGNPEKYIAASTKVDSDSNWNIMAEIDETKRSLKFVWSYGPDINNQTTGSIEYTKHLQLSRQYLNLSDVELIRKFLNDNGIEITTDRRINE